MRLNRKTLGSSKSSEHLRRTTAQIAISEKYDKFEKVNGWSSGVYSIKDVVVKKITSSRRMVKSSYRKRFSLCGYDGRKTFFGFWIESGETIVCGNKN